MATRPIAATATLPTRAPSGTRLRDADVAIAHRDPGVGHDTVGILDRGFRIVADHNCRA
jgi:hypothetical protein